MYVGIDPGIRATAIAVGNHKGELIKAALIPNPARRGHGIAEVTEMARALHDWLSWEFGAPAVTLAVEWMQVYTNGKSKGDQNVSITPLIGVVSAFAGYLDARNLLAVPPVDYYPHDWKGSVDPEECTRRVRERLSVEEHGRVILPENSCAVCRAHLTLEMCQKPNSCTAHNVWDAVGVMLKIAGRFERKRVIAR